MHNAHLTYLCTAFSGRPAPLPAPLPAPAAPAIAAAANNLILIFCLPRCSPYPTLFVRVFL